MKIGFVVACAAIMGCSWAGSYQPLQGQGIKNPQGGSFTSAIGTVAYGGTMMGYGGTVEDDHLVTMSGEITATWVWVRDRVPNPDPSALTDGNPNNDTVEDPLDVPPEEVIVVQYCDASYTGMYYPEGTGMGSCSNGLGAPDVSQVDIYYTYDEEGNQIVWHYVVSGRSVGIKSEQRAGSETLTVTCSPSAEAHVPLAGVVRAKINYSCGIVTPTVTLEGVTHFYSPERVQGVITGQEVTGLAGLSISPEVGSILANLGSPPNGIRFTSYQWRIPTSLDPFFRFNVTLSSAARENHRAQHLRSQSVRFFTNKDGTDKLILGAKIALPNGLGGETIFSLLANSKNLQSVRPIGDFLVRTGDVQHAVYYGAAGFMFHGNASSTHGQQWLDAEVELSTHFGSVGRALFCQIITASRELIRELKPGAPSGTPVRFVKAEHNGLAALDAGFPYPYGDVWELPGMGYGVDSPFQPYTLDLGLGNEWTEKWLSSTANDSFKTWLLYLPPSVGGRPVAYIPLRS
jgi:hypothetical protein